MYSFAIRNGQFNSSCTSDGDIFKCLAGPCIPKSLHCDGNDDCADGSDELYCASKCEGEDWFRCSNGHCISTLWLCDKEDDCMDWSDEANCPVDEVLKPIDESSCPGSDFRCGDGLCIPVSWICDDQDDCHAGEDENPKLCGKEKECKEFTCTTSGTCIPHRWVCDGGADCLDGSDEGNHCGQEKNGTESCKTEQGWYPCQDGSRCLKAEHVCNSVPQCEDGSDEGIFCSRKPDCSTKQCSYKCLMFPSGPSCYCEPGYQLDTDDKTCVDIDECQMFGSCSQKCVNTVGSFTCSCLEGYTIYNGSCVASVGEPILFFSTKSEVRGLKVRSMQYFPLATNLPFVIGVGFDSVDGRVYWTDVEAGKEVLVSIGLDGSSIEKLVTNGLDMPEDLALDEVNRNVYLTDSVRKHLAVCDLDGKGCIILVSDIEQPRAVAIHKKRRHVLYTDWGSKPAVVIVAMDGSSKRDLVNEDVIWPNGLAVDEVLDRIYWSDAKKDTVESIHVDGTGRMVILDTVAKHPFSLAVFEDMLYWSDWEMQEIVSCNKFNGKNFKTLVKEAGIHPMGITISHPLLTYSDLPSPCINSPCSHVCLPLPSPSTQFKCACPAGFVLSSATQCVESAEASKLFLSTTSHIYSVHPHMVGRKSYTSALAMSTSNIITSITASTVDDTVFIVIRGANSKIVKFDKDTGFSKPVIFGDQFGSISYDPLSRNLFWVDVNKLIVVVHNLDTGANTEVLLTNSNPLTVLHVPEKNRLLVAERNKISMVQLGSVDICQVKSEKLIAPTSLVYSSLVDAVFIGDSGSKAIYKWTWDSNVVVSFVENIGTVVSMAVRDSWLYWVELSGTNILWVSIHNSNVLSWLPINSIASPNDLLHLTLSGGNNTKRSHLNNDCAAANCSHICFNLDISGHICSCPYGMSLTSDKITCQESCGEHVFSCGDGKCIPSDWQCDGTGDCKDLSDEANCTEVKIAKCNNRTQATCGDGACVLSSWWCDGDEDCPDASDEKDCPAVNCGDGRVSCADGKQCVLEHWKCDGSEDCNDGSDEIGCDVQCLLGQFQCKDEKLCIEQQWVCDHNLDCSDGSDEKNCTFMPQECTRSEFKCTNNNCVSMELFCNGDNDCGDNSDEAEQICHRRIEDPFTDIITCVGGFACGPVCLPMSVRCNGTYECVDESDEQGCSLCTEDTFSCSDGGRCIPTSWVCDYAADCNDGSDEANCDAANDTIIEKCLINEFQCNSGECVSLTATCNGHPDCVDGSDEEPFQCGKSCSSNGGCPQSCQPTPRGPVCQCYPGYSLNLTNGSPLCLDVDECTNPSSCSQYCTNTKGSFKCSCAEGYTKEGRHCRAGGEPPKLLYAVHNKINGLLMRPDSTYRVDMEFTSHSVPIRSFDYSPTSHEFFWTSPALGVIGRYSIDTGLLSKNEVWMSGINKPNQVVVDWITGNIYFSELSSSSITVCANKSLCTQVCTVPVNTVTLLKVDPKEGRLFVAGYSKIQNGYPRGAIYPYSMDGELVSDAEVIGAAKAGIPSGLALDLITRRVYWSDVTSRDISVCSYEGRNCHVVTTSSQLHPNFLTIYESKLYWLIGQQGLVYSYDLLSQQTHSRYDLTLPASSHNLMFVHSSLSSQSPLNPCSSLKCSSICLLTLTSARCSCPQGSVPHDALSESCIFPDSKKDDLHLPTTNSDRVSNFSDQMEGTTKTDENLDDVSIEATVDENGMKDGAILALAIIIILAAFVAGIVLCVKCRNSVKKQEVALMFTNMAYGIGTPERSCRGQELHHVQIVQRGSAHGIENPGYDSPRVSKQNASKHCTTSWPSPSINSSDPVICEGISTSIRPRANKETDPATSSMASSLEENQFTVGEDDDDMEQLLSGSYNDKQSLLN